MKMRPKHEKGGQHMIMRLKNDVTSIDVMEEPLIMS